MLPCAPYTSSRYVLRVKTDTPKLALESKARKRMVRSLDCVRSPLRVGT